MARSKQEHRHGAYITSSVAEETVRAFHSSPYPNYSGMDCISTPTAPVRNSAELGRLNGMTGLLNKPAFHCNTRSPD
jgi:hypothetical protein